MTDLEGTQRIEAFSDGVIAIIITILILEIRVPEIHVLTNRGVFDAIVPLFPKLFSFMVSFFTIAIFWVNHHHFFHALTKSNSKLLWYNNHLLFWLAVVPFVTAFIGDYSTLPVVVALYGFVLAMAAAAFSLMIYFVFFKSTLALEQLSHDVRRMQFKRSLVGIMLYGAAVPLAFVQPYISLALFIAVPLYYFLPKKIVG